ncbi:MAG: DUF885 domain-containing protein [Gammaproteobacteria bacterium]|nr:DUF885 domain-containing protein [Gammaproteobacteria bacterium]MBT8050639.1 DUF885 domain-containing protein [Gammaproteobacteria bacterium]MBT8057720.1 DUF885 domain-containing protein [Gammaproteobacteria bacterium]NNJ78127.1 DUF885 domain-containing protein [Xanthomonadales bacterium]
MRVLKRLLKITGTLLLVVIVAGGLFLAHTWYFKPVNINLFFARTMMQIMLDSPQMLSSLRVLEPIGITGHNAKLDDDSLAAGDRFMQQMKDAYDVLLSYEDDDLSEGDLVSKKIAVSMMGAVVEGEKFRFHTFPVNQMFGVQNNFPSFMESTHQVHSVSDAEDYVSRLNAVGVKFDQVLEGLRHREDLGIHPPQFVVTKVLEEMDAFVNTPAEEGILMVALLEKMEEAGLPEDEQQRLAREARTAIETTVYPAYGRLIEHFVALDDKVQYNHGAWSLPDGDDYYRLALRLMTTTDYSPEYIHGVGLSEVDRIQGEILDILATEGWDVSSGFTAAINEMAEQDRFYYSDSGEGRDQILADYTAMIEDVEARLDPWFETIPEAVVEVDRVPEFKEKTSPGAYYSPAAMDGSRPGMFYANLYDIKATPTYGMRTLTYHEAVPGHHFQISIQREQEDLPFFRRLIPFPAFSEGWALYAERLAKEMGLLEDPYDNIGRLQAELFRAVRLVVDTGIHWARWSREEAIDYMRANTGMAESDVVAEIERYFIIPGQATSYKVGMTKILELRALAETELGDRFDIREFHDVVLTGGSMPLDILEQRVRRWIASIRA